MTDPVRDINVIVSATENKMYAMYPNKPSAELSTLSVTGDLPTLSEYAALEYAPNLDCFVFYSANDGARLFAITAPPGSNWTERTHGQWPWRSLLDSPNRLDPITDAASTSNCCLNRDHTFGRFRVASYGDTDVALLVRHIDTAVYALRLN